LRNRVQDSSGSLAKIRNRELWPLSQFFPVTAIDENRAAAGGMGAIDVAPSIADEETSLQVDVVRRRRAQQHARFWLPAIAWIAVSAAGVKTNFDGV
jgi:hypothetical protein